MLSHPISRLTTERASCALQRNQLTFLLRVKKGVDASLGGALNAAVVNGVHNPRSCEALAGQVEVCPGEGPRYGAQQRWGEGGYLLIEMFEID